MSYKPTPARLKLINKPYRVKLLIDERKKTGWTFYLRYWNGKKQIRVILNSKDFELSNAMRNKLDSEISHSIKQQFDTYDEVLLSNFRELYLEYCTDEQMAKPTISQKSWILNALINYLDDPLLNSVTTNQLDNYKTFLLSQGKKPRTVRTNITVIKAALNWALKKKMVQSNPALNVEHIRVPRQSPRRFSQNQFQQLLEVIDRDEDHDIALVLVLTGLRISELLSLKWQNVQIKDSVMIIRGKGGHDREVHLGKLVVDILKRQPTYNETDYVFPGMRIHGNKLVPHGQK